MFADSLIFSLALITHKTNFIYDFDSLITIHNILDGLLALYPIL